MFFSAWIVCTIYIVQNSFFGVEIIVKRPFKICHWSKDQTSVVSVRRSVAKIRCVADGKITAKPAEVSRSNFRYLSSCDQATTFTRIKKLF